MRTGLTSRLRFLIVVPIFFGMACASVPDVPICVDLTNTPGNVTKQQGWCAWTITQKEQFVDNDTNLLGGKRWSEVKMVSLLVPPDSWAKLKSYIIKNCKQNKGCNNDIGKWQRKTATFDSKLGIE